MAVMEAVAESPEIFRDKDVLWFVDNEAACASLIRGASSQEDVAVVAEVVHLLTLRLGCRIWFEWIDSKSNPSDGLSRLGLACPDWGAWAKVAGQPPWTDPQRTARAVLEEWGNIGGRTLEG